jgi:methylmalonyl-CoA epimerase
VAARGAQEGGYSLTTLVVLAAAWALSAALLAWLLSWPAWPAVALGLPAGVLLVLLWGAAEDLLSTPAYLKRPCNQKVFVEHLKKSSGASPMDMKVEHIGIATARLDDALRFWRDALGLEVVHTEVVEEQGVRVAMLPVGEPRIELLEPTGEGSPVAKFLEKRGPGIHHVAVRVPDIRAALARLKDRGARLIDAEPRVGAGGCLVAFVHPQAAGGVLLELVEHRAHEPESER